MKQNIYNTTFIVVCFLALYLLENSLQAFPLRLGIALLVSFIAGEILSKSGLPRISTYLIIGIITGPYAVSFFSLKEVADLRIIDSIALSTIAFVAGSDIDFRKGGIKFSKIFSFSLMQFVIGFSAALLIFYIMGKFFHFSLFTNISFILFLALILNAVSPATTVAVIKETGSKGKLTDYVLSTAILKDFTIIVCFSILLSLLGSQGEEASITKVLTEEFVSAASGIAAGFAVFVYMRFVKINLGVFLFLTIIIITWICREMHLSNLMVFITAGIFLNNFTRFGSIVTESIDKNFNIILLIFFFSAGMVIDLRALMSMFGLAVFIVILRIVILYVSCYISGSFIKEDFKIKQLSFMGFLGQAGVSIGFAKIIASIFPFGDIFQTLILAVVGINQIMGPVLFRFSLQKAGEIK
ncbi:cation:proton antiporter [Flexistipes sinusarabici]|uniref:cation:proton antiporter n=1 Tax=Flexistipes sinusarabici TaxID=2352 RepID=UPI002356565F|nr:cation:proton antiporter [Flexistipes sinusarabici]